MRHQPTILKNQTVVITGANGGMGRACSQLLADQGWHVLAIDHDDDGLSTLNNSSQFKVLKCDVKDEQLTEKVTDVVSGMPPVLGLVNLVGRSTGDSINQQLLEDWREAFEINVTPAMRLTQLLAPNMQSQGGGSVINVGSPVGLIGARKAGYAASKGALLELTMSCARQLGVDNIRVNLLLPGPTITKMTDDWSEEKRRSIGNTSFLKRLCTAEEIAQTISFLLGPSSSYITGSIIDMTAGSMYGH